MKTTPTRRRRRANDAQIERWGERDEPEVPVVALPPALRQQQSAQDGEPAATAQRSVDPPNSSSTDANAPAPELLSAEDILRATDLHQRLDRLQSAIESQAYTRSSERAADAHELRSVCTELIEKFPWLSLSKDIDQRLWTSWQRELAALETTIAASGSVGKESGERQLRDALYVALSNYSALIQRVKAAAADSNGTRALLVHRLSLANAHVLYALEVHSSSAEKTWRMAEEYYETARCWHVAQGETHYHLARIVLHDGRCSEALYHLIRSRTAEQPYASPGSLAAQFAHVSSLRESSKGTSTDASESLTWSQFDKAVLLTVAPFFGQQQEFLVQRRAPRELVLALCCYVDSILQKEAKDHADRHVPPTTLHSLQLVRIVCLLIACACLDPRFVEMESTTGDHHAALASVKNPRAVEILLTCINGLLHRMLTSITSPLLSTGQREHALQVLLPSINVAFSWLRGLAWRDLVGESARSNCERLSAMVLTGIISGGFLAPLEEQLSSQASHVVLKEDVELCGFKCIAQDESAAAVVAIQAADAQADDHNWSDRDLLQRRIGNFLSAVEHFVAPRLNIVSSSDSAPLGVRAAPTTAPSPPSVESIREGLRQTQLEDNSTARLTSSNNSNSSNNSSAVSVSASSITPPVATKPAERVVVLDAANIAMRHGLQRRFSCRGIQLCAEYFIAQGDRVVAFLPDYCLDLEASRKARRRERWSLTQEDRSILEVMVDSGVVVLTPAMDSDDLYCIHYARRHGAFLVTNDLFRDHISDTDGPRARQQELRSWLTAQRISYTWVGDEFLPNPNSAYEKLRAAVVTTNAQAL